MKKDCRTLMSCSLVLYLSVPCWVCLHAEGL